MLNVVGQVYKHPKYECYASNSILNFIFSIRLNVQRHHWIDYLIFLKKKRRINQETKSSSEHCVFLATDLWTCNISKQIHTSWLLSKCFIFWDVLPSWYCTGNGVSQKGEMSKQTNWRRIFICCRPIWTDTQFVWNLNCIAQMSAEIRILLNYIQISSACAAETRQTKC